MRESIVLYPAASFHHMISMVELGKLLLQHQPHLFITILVPAIPSDASTTSSYINHISKTNLPISFFFLPPPQQDSHRSQNPIALAAESIRLNVPHVVDAFRTLSLSSSVLGLITSAVPFCDDSLHIPMYYYYTSCASSLAVLLYLPTLHKQRTRSFKDLDSTLLHIPGLPPIKASDMPQPLLQRDNPAYNYFLDLGSSLPKSTGIILNTFESLESHAIKAIADGDCAQNGLMPAVYPIGPLITDAKDRIGTFNDASYECLAWLSAQPSKSVVFLCFGRRGTFSEAQLQNIASGLERSNQRFLWVVKSPQGSTTKPNLEVLLSKGYLHRTKERGLVLESWAPQNDILSHESVGGFVTHCGWNSVLEAVSSGVPMVAWPLYAEQQTNAVVLVDEMKLAIAINMAISSKDGEKEVLVTAEEVEKRVRQLMELEEGKVLRKQSLQLRSMARAAWSSGGSSLTAFPKLVASWKAGLLDTKGNGDTPEVN